MQNVLVPGAVVLLTVVLWLRRKPVKAMLSSTDTSSVAQLNRAQLELVLEPSNPDTAVEDPLADRTAPQTEQDRLALQQRLRQRMASGPEQRLDAVREAALWGHRSVLPLLKRALRDSDARVVEAAAEAMERFRGAPRRAPAHTVRPPRNVSRMR